MVIAIKCYQGVIRYFRVQNLILKTAALSSKYPLNCHWINLHLKLNSQRTNLYEELNLFKKIVPRDWSALGVLKFVIQNNFLEICFNVVIAYKILLRVPIIVAWAGRFFSKLKIIKYYLQSCIWKEQMTLLSVTMSIEIKVLKVKILLT